MCSLFIPKTGRLWNRNGTLFSMGDFVFFKLHVLISITSIFPYCLTPMSQLAIIGPHTKLPLIFKLIFSPDCVSHYLVLYFYFKYVR